jgi:hypothetical protein
MHNNGYYTWSVRRIAELEEYATRLEEIVQEQADDLVDQAEECEFCGMAWDDGSWAGFPG